MFVSGSSWLQHIKRISCAPCNWRRRKAADRLRMPNAMLPGRIVHEFMSSNNLHPKKKQAHEDPITPWNALETAWRKYSKFVAYPRPWKSKKNLKRLVPWNTKSLLKVMVMVFPKSSAMKISWPKNGKKHAAAACINFLHRIFPCWDINVANLMQKLTIILGVSLIKLHKITTKKPIWVWFYA